MISGAGVACVVQIHARSVGFDALSIDVRTDWAARLDLGADVVVSFDRAVLRQSDFGIGGDCG